MIDQQPPRPRQRKPEEHVVGYEVRNVIALVGRAGYPRPRDVPPFRHRQQQREQGEGGGIVLSGGETGDVDLIETGIHVVHGVQHYTAGAEQFRRDLVRIEAAVDRIARDQADGRYAGFDQLPQSAVVVFGNAESDELSPAPRPAAVHRGIDAAGQGALAGIPKLPVESGAVPVGIVV